MDRGTESYESPLDEVLEGLPQEQPPADLKDRCIAALDVPTARVVRPAWMHVMRNVAAAAAVLILVAGVYNVGVAPSRDKARMASSLSNAGPTVAERPVAEEPEQARPEVVAGPAVPQDYVTMGLPAAAPQEPAPSDESAGVVLYRVRSSREASAGIEVVRGDEVATLTQSGVPPQAPGGVREPATHVTAYRDYDGDHIAALESETPSDIDAVYAGRLVASAPSEDRVMRSVTEGETEPWRDLSGDRQVSYHKEMELEVAKVEQAHQRVREIVTRRGGYIASDQVRIQEDSPDSARLTIRLPIHAYEDAIEDLKELGEVVRLVGESVDRTHEYYTRGAEVREMADREADLLRKYEAETNAQKKRRLKQQLDALRAQLHAQKDLLGRLSEETHWPILELTLTESSDGPGGFLSRSLENSVNALAWVGATAIIWLPAVVIVTLFWRRRTS